MSNLDWYRNAGLAKPRPTPQQQRQVPVFTPNVGQPQPGYDAMQAPEGQVKFGTAMQYWRGSREAATTDNGNCPRCHSPNYMSSVRSESAAGGKGGLAMGHCMDCSYRPQHDVLSGPSMQTQSSLRGFNDPSIPVRQSRQAKSVGFQRNQVIAHIK